MSLDEVIYHLKSNLSNLGLRVVNISHFPDIPNPEEIIVDCMLRNVRVRGCFHSSQLRGYCGRSLDVIITFCHELKSRAHSELMRYEEQNYPPIHTYNPVYERQKFMVNPLPDIPESLGKIFKNKFESDEFIELKVKKQVKLNLIDC